MSSPKIDPRPQLAPGDAMGLPPVSVSQVELQATSEPHVRFTRDDERDSDPDGSEAIGEGNRRGSELNKIHSKRRNTQLLRETLHFDEDSMFLAEKSMNASSETILSAFELADEDGNGYLSKEEFVSVVRAMRADQQESMTKEIAQELKIMDVTRKKKLAQKVGMILSVVLLAVLLGNFGLTFAVVFLSKDQYIGSNNRLETAGGDPILISNDKLTVTADGVVVAQVTSVGGARRLADNPEGAKPLGVAIAERPATISSTMPDTLLDGLQRIRVESGPNVLSLWPKGHLRVFTPASKCGSLVKVMTTIGILTLDDTVIYFDARAQAFLEQHGFFFGVDATLAGRQLQSEAPGLTGYLPLASQP